MNPLVGIIMGSQSDLPTLEPAIEFLKSASVSHEVEVVSAHRTPDEMVAYAKSAASRGLRVIIAAAGGAAHLPGMVASFTTLPVIGVPVQTSALGGEDSLLSIVQMPDGIPVATVGIGRGANAAILACRILALQDESLAQFLLEHEARLQDKVKAMNESVRTTWPPA